MDAGTEVTGTLEVFGSSKGTKLLARHAYGLWRFAWVGLVVLFIVLFVFAIWLAGKVGPWAGGGETLVLAGLLVCAASAVFMLQRLVNQIGYRRWYARGVSSHVTFTYAVTVEGLVMSSEHGRAIVFWSSFNEVAVDRHNWALISAGVVYFVPRRFFADNSEERAFVSAVLSQLTPDAQARSERAYKELSSLTAT